MKEKLDKIIHHLHNVLAELRTGRASPALVENLQIDSYGAILPLKSVAAISTPESRQILIKPWDKNMLLPIQRAIQSSNIGLNPIADQDTIRLSIPPLTEERRKELVKNMKQRAEEARIAVRRAREEEMKEIDRKERAKEISETDKFKQRDAVQKTIDEYNKKIDDVGKEKEKEIMTI